MWFQADHKLPTFQARGWQVFDLEDVYIGWIITPKSRVFNFTMAWCVSLVTPEDCSVWTAQTSISHQWQTPPRTVLEVAEMGKVKTRCSDIWTECQSCPERQEISLKKFQQMWEDDDGRYFALFKSLREGEMKRLGELLRTWTHH